MSTKVYKDNVDINPHPQNNTNTRLTLTTTHLIIYMTPMTLNPNKRNQKVDEAEKTISKYERRAEIEICESESGISEGNE